MIKRSLLQIRGNSYRYLYKKQNIKTAVRGLVVGMILSFSLFFSSQLFSQESKGVLYGGLGLGLSNQAILPHQQKRLQIGSSPVSTLVYELGYQMSIHKSIIARSGVGYKTKGVKIDSKYLRYGKWKTARYIEKNHAISASIATLFMPGKNKKKSIYLLLGAACDWIIGDKPQASKYLDKNTPVYFDNDKYKRMTVNALFGLGVPIYQSLSLQLLYSRALRDSFSDNQLSIRDNFWSITFTVSKVKKQ